MNKIYDDFGKEFEIDFSEAEISSEPFDAREMFSEEEIDFLKNLCN